MKASAPYETSQIKTIEQRLEMLASLGRAYFSEEANQLKKQLAELRQAENEKLCHLHNLKK